MKCGELRRLTVVLLLSAATMVLAAPPAMAHAELIESDPAQGATLATVPTQVRLTFNEPVSPAPNLLEIIGPGNATWTVGTPAVAGAVITIPVTPTGPAGPVTLAYRVVSSDGDPVTGSFRFTLAATPVTTTTVPPTTTTTTTTTVTPEPTTTTAAPTGNTAEPADDDGGGVPAWVWIVGAAVVVAVGAGIAVSASRRRTNSTR
jgi:copper resistance protein C